jgi:hypothetical protein
MNLWQRIIFPSQADGLISHADCRFGNLVLLPCFQVSSLVTKAPMIQKTNTGWLMSLNPFRSNSTYQQHPESCRLPGSTSDISNQLVEELLNRVCNQIASCYEINF